MKQIYEIGIKQEFEVHLPITKFKHFKFVHTEKVTKHWVFGQSVYILANDANEAADKYNRLFLSPSFDKTRLIPHYEECDEDLIDVQCNMIDESLYTIFEFDNYIHNLETYIVGCNNCKPYTNITINQLVDHMLADDFKEWWQQTENGSIAQFLKDKFVDTSKAINIDHMEQ